MDCIARDGAQRFQWLGGSIMPEIIEIIEDTDIIQITSYGEITEKDLRISRETVHKLCSEHGFTKVLVNATAITNKINTIAAFEHGSILACNNLFRKAKHAIVVSKNNIYDLILMNILI